MGDELIACEDVEQHANEASKRGEKVKKEK